MIMRLISGLLKFWFVVEWPLWQTSTTNNGQLVLVGRTFFTLLFKLTVNGKLTATFVLPLETINELSARLRHQLEGGTGTIPAPLHLGEGYWLTISHTQLAILWTTPDGAAQEFIANRPNLRKLYEELDEYSTTPEVQWAKAS